MIRTVEEATAAGLAAAAADPPLSVQQVAAFALLLAPHRPLVAARGLGRPHLLPVRTRARGHPRPC